MNSSNINSVQAFSENIYVLRMLARYQIREFSSTAKPSYHAKIDIYYFVCDNNNVRESILQPVSLRVIRLSLPIEETESVIAWESDESK